METYFWNTQISKEMENVLISFEKLDTVTPDETRKGNVRSGYENVNVQMIFESNMYGKLTIEEI